MDEIVVFVYYGDDGPVFDRRCRKCGRWTKAPDSVRYKKNLADDIQNMDCPGICKKCGPVQLEHIGWAGDFR